jgi:hypothetical protein
MARIGDISSLTFSGPHWTNYQATGGYQDATVIDWTQIGSNP